MKTGAILTCDSLGQAGPKSQLATDRAAAAAISTYSYHPTGTFVSTRTNPHLFIASDRTLSNTASVWGTQVSLDTITIVVKEFWPDIHRKLSHKSKTAQAGSAQQ